jgi:CRISPR-associated protein Cmr4
MNTRLIFVHALSPLHAGTGQGVGVIDLPIAREKATGLPYLPGSSLKGTLRDEFNEPSDLHELRDKIFGPEKNNASDFAGAIQFTDQTLALLPVRSLAGTFAWVTSPYVLRRLKRDATDAGATGVPAAIPTPKDVEHCAINPSKLIVEGINKVCLEDLDLRTDVTQSTHVQAWADWLKDRIFPAGSAWQTMFAERLCVVHDDVLSFILNTATEITARVKIKDDVKTVEKGGLWYEEALPTETVLFGLALAFPNSKTEMKAADIFSAIQKKLEKALQLGGKATVGRGICRVKMSNAIPNGG